MKKRLTLLAATAAAALVLTGCAGTDGGGDTGTDAPAEGETSGELFEVATDVDLEGSPTFDEMTERGSVKIGVKEDQPGLGYLDAATGERTGFDIEISKWIAASLGFAE